MNKIPHHRKVYEVLRKRIADGIYSEGDLLPSENELSSTYGVTRATIRIALNALLNEGYIKKHHGKGSIVQSRPQGIGILSITGITSAIGQDNLRTKIIVKPELRKLEEAFSFQLTQKEIDAGCIYFERLRMVNKVPVFYDITIVPNIDLPSFISIDFENKSLFDILRRRYHIQVRGGEQKISATTADKSIQKYFNVGRNFPILLVNRKFETNRIDFHFYSQVRCNTSDYFLYGTF